MGLGDLLKKVMATGAETPAAAATSPVLPVFDAVHAAYLERAGKAQLFQWGVKKTWAEGGEDPLEKVRAYLCNDEKPHWHYVTSGLADPEKIEGDEECSGLGYEFTFRVARGADEQSPPIWPVTALQELGWGIFKADMQLDRGHYIRRRTRITGAGGPPSELVGYYLLDDAQMPTLTTETGRVKFLQLVGINEDELLTCEAGRYDELEQALEERSSLGITDIARKMQQPEDALARMMELEMPFFQLLAGSAPEGIDAPTFTATLDEKNLVCEIEAATPFDLSYRAQAALKRIFVHQANIGQAVKRIRGGLRDGRGWLEFAYAEADAD